GYVLHEMSLTSHRENDDSSRGDGDLAAVDGAVEGDDALDPRDDDVLIAVVDQEAVFAATDDLELLGHARGAVHTRPVQDLAEQGPQIRGARAFVVERGGDVPGAARAETVARDGRVSGVGALGEGGDGLGAVEADALGPDPAPSARVQAQ